MRLSGMTGDIQFQPVCEDDTKDVESELDGNELSTRGVVRDFCSPDGDDGVQDTRTDTIYKTRCKSSASLHLTIIQRLHTANHPLMIHSRTLQRSTQNRPPTTNSNGLNPSNPITNPATQQRTT